MSVAQIVISTAPHESQTLAFNYASLALNNSFFLHHLVRICLPVCAPRLSRVGWTNQCRNLQQIPQPKTTNLC